ncbi:MAG: hypothetical protein AAFY00_10490 [Bacteroidota bacterium]
MGASKQQFLEQRQWMVMISEEVYCSIPFELRNQFKSERAVYPDEHQRLYETDTNYKELYKTYRAAKKDVEEYKFRKRHSEKRTQADIE